MPSSSADAFQESRPSSARTCPQPPSSVPVIPREGPVGFEDIATLRQACSSECRGAQGAFKDSMIHGRSAIHITYRDSLRPSSTREPRDPSLKVVPSVPPTHVTHTVHER